MEQRQHNGTPSEVCLLSLDAPSGASGWYKAPVYVRSKTHEMLSRLVKRLKPQGAQRKQAEQDVVFRASPNLLLVVLIGERVLNASQVSLEGISEACRKFYLTISSGAPPPTLYLQGGKAVAYALKRRGSTLCGSAGYLKALQGRKGEKRRGSCCG